MILYGRCPQCAGECHFCHCVLVDQVTENEISLYDHPEREIVDDDVDRDPTLNVNENFNAKQEI